MSKTSHARHEHESNYNPNAHAELEAMEADSFAHRHKTLIWVVIIGMVILLPIVFGVLTVLNAL